jgi:CheY-like chemotaxis protein
MDLLPFIKEQVKLLERTLPESIQIDMDYHHGEYMIEADPTRLQQALMNLAFNARDAMPEGGRLHIELSHLSQDALERCATCGQVFEEREWLRVTISDTGCGIPADVLPHIFDPFFTTKAPGQGTGLGLAQVYGLIKQHEGHVDVQTRIDQGATFNLYLPTLPQATHPYLDQDSISLMKGKGQTILLVEDEAATLQALVDGLTLLEYKAITAMNGREALTILEQRGEKIDLILSDVVMPEMGGIALLHAIRQRGFATPVVLMTGHPLQEELEELQSKGLAAWLIKPLGLKQLSKIITRTIG